MYNFGKYLVKDTKAIDSIMYSNIGASWDYIDKDKKYPIEYPALLVVDEDNKNFDYIYPSIFEEDDRSVGDCVYFEYCHGRSLCHNHKTTNTRCSGICEGFTTKEEYK